MSCEFLELRLAPKDFNRLEFHFTKYVGKEDFFKTLNDIKSLPSRKYDPKSKIWSIPKQHLNVAKNKFNEKLLVNIPEEDIKDCIDPKDIPDTHLYVDIPFTKHHKHQIYQIKGMNFLYLKKKALLADDVGYGKSIQAFGASRMLKKEGKAKRCLIICKATNIYDWDTKTPMHTFEKSMPIYGTINQRNKIYNDLEDGKLDDVFYFITSYETFRNDLGIIKTFDFDICIIDESLKIKNHQSQIGKAIHSVANFDYVWCLTGTPINNKPLDFYNTLKLLGVETCSFTTFKEKYAVLDFWGNPIKYVNLENLYEQVYPIMLRRDDELDLPDLINDYIYLKFPPKQQKGYNAIKKQMFEDEKDGFISKEIEKIKHNKNVVQKYYMIHEETKDKAFNFHFRGKKPKLDSLCDPIFDFYATKINKLSSRLEKENIPQVYIESELKETIDVEASIRFLHQDEFKQTNLTATNILAQTTKLRQATVSLELLGGDNVSVKLDWIKEFLEDLPHKDNKGKVIIFSFFRTFIDIIERELTKSGYKVCKITGKTNNKTVAENVHKFQNDPEYTIMLLTEAGKECHTLTTASYTIICDSLWSYSDEEQVIGRMNRFGQNQKMVVYRLIVKNSVDEKMEKIKKIKQAFFEYLVEGKRDADTLEVLDDLITEELLDEINI